MKFFIFCFSIFVTIIIIFFSVASDDQTYDVSERWMMCDAKKKRKELIDLDTSLAK